MTVTAPRAGLREGAPPFASPAPVTLALWSVLLYLPFVWLGYGTDIDITNVLRSGASILDGDYRYSRPPGAFPHELTTGLLDRLGGSILVNVGSVAAAVVTLVMLARIVEREHGPRAGRIAVVLAATQPWFWVTATSLGDYLYALALFLTGVDAARRDARVVAGLAFGLAIGFRAATALLVVSWLLAELTGGLRWLDERGRRRLFVTGSVAVVVGIACFVPPWLSVGRTAQFLENQLRTGDVTVMIARWGVKNVAFFGAVTIVLLLVRLPVLLAPLQRFRALVLVRFAVFAAVAIEALYLRFPWKPAHLLPVALCLAILVAVSDRSTTRFVGALVGAQLLLAVVSFSVAEPDVADAATDGRFAPGITRGVVVNDVLCRFQEDFDVEFEGDWPDLATPEADYAAVGAFACQARSWRAGEGPSLLETSSALEIRSSWVDLERRAP